MSKKTKKIILAIILLIILAFIGWVIFKLTFNDIKGEVNVVRKAYYRIINILPVKPAIKLTVPYHHQEHPLSCEVASLLMALKFREVKVTESELIKELPVIDPGHRQPDNVWGDPNLGFVGNINGSMPDTGYGVYEQPIYDLAKKYRDAKIINNGSLAELINELNANNPVIVWGVSGKGKDISWKTPEGKVISAKMDEHARTLIGYTGNSDNPQLMIFNDPIYGEIRMKVKDFLANWQLLDRRAVVVY